jgi:hypothetical protein
MVRQSAYAAIDTKRTLANFRPLKACSQTRLRAALYVVRWFYTVTSRRSQMQRLIQESAVWPNRTPMRNQQTKETSFCEGLLTVIGLLPT